MTNVKVPGVGTMIAEGSDEAVRAQATINERQAFSLKYMEEQGWGTDPGALTIEQILEIRDQPEWKREEEISVYVVLPDQQRVQKP